MAALERGRAQGLAADSTASEKECRSSARAGWGSEGKVVVTS